MLVVGAPADLPRAFNHPAVVTNRFVITNSVGIDPEAADATVLDRFSELLDGADGVLVAGLLGRAVMQRLTDLAALHGRELLAVMPTDVLHAHDPIVVWHAESPLVRLASGAERRTQLAVKRLLDIVGAGLLLTVLAPMLAILMVMIRLESPGSPIFRHTRVGLRGRRFACLKLRTMRLDAELELRSDPDLHAEYVRNHYKIPDDRDPRVTRFGRLLRRTSLDELPQLWNVLMGHMSLVGPRPVVDDELELYGDARDVVLSVRPGITGAWAVSGRQQVGYPQRCEIELRYVREWSLRADAPILLKTIRVVAAPLINDRRDLTA